MRLNAKHNWKLKLGILLFLIGQAVSFAHASEHGSIPHDHDGVACIGILSDENDLLVLNTGLSAPVVYAIAANTDPVRRVLNLACPYAFQPPATGPPSI